MPLHVELLSDSYPDLLLLDLAVQCHVVEMFPFFNLTVFFPANLTLVSYIKIFISATILIEFSHKMNPWKTCRTMPVLLNYEMWVSVIQSLSICCLLLPNCLYVSG